MKISRIEVFQLDIPLEKPKRHPNRTYESLDDTIVRLETDSGGAGTDLRVRRRPHRDSGCRFQR